MKFLTRKNDATGTWQYALVGGSHVPVWNGNHYESEDEAIAAVSEVLNLTDTEPERYEPPVARTF